MDGFKAFWRKLVKRDGASLNEDEELLVPGPQNILTVRSLTHIERINQSSATAKAERAPPSQGNNHWGVISWHNSIKTSQYTWWSFIFLNLFQQIIIPANLYFIVMAVLQLIPAISDSNGIPTYLFPLGFVFAVTMIKDLFEDVKRHASDREENKRRTQILTQDGEWSECRWSDIRPGDIVKVEADEVFPADLLMITNSDDDGIAYVGTVQLDGETNMKTKTAIPYLHETYSNNTENLAKSTVEVVYGPPNAKLYQFQGVLRFYDKSHDFTRANNQLKATLSKQRSLFGAGDFKTSLSQPPSGTHLSSAARIDVSATPSDLKHLTEMRSGSMLPTDTPADYGITMNQFLWRGATLTNTGWVCGVAVYTGHHTRISKNTRSRALKYSGLMKSYNYNAISLFLMLMGFCILAGILYVVDVNKIQANSWYLMPNASAEFSGTVGGSSVAFAVCFGRYILLLSYFIPITLLVQIEIARWFHGYYIHADVNSHSEVTDTYPSVSTLSVIEDLGCVTHVFSDKTGTLTQNIMQLKSFAINGIEMDTADEEVSTEEVLAVAAAPGHKNSSRCLADVNESSEVFVDAIETAHLSRLYEVSLKDDGMEVGDEADVDPEKKQKRIATLRMSPNRYVMFNARSVRKKLLLDADKTTQTAARGFLLVLSVCHSVLPKTTSVVTRVIEPENVPGNGNETNETITLQIPPSAEPLPRAESTSSSSLPRQVSVQSGQESRYDSSYRSSQRSIQLPSCSEDDHDVGVGEITPSAESRFDPMARHQVEPDFSPPPWMPSPNTLPSTPLTLEDQQLEEDTSSSDNDSANFEPQLCELPPHQPPNLEVTARSPKKNRHAHFLQRSFTPPFGAARPDEEVRRVVRKKKYTDAFHGAVAPEMGDASFAPEIAAVRWNEVLEAAYDASSPDELALVAGAKHLGVEFLRRPDLNTIEVAVLNENAERLFMTGADRDWIARQRTEKNDPTLLPSLIFQVIEVLDFDNFRKRMSVIIKDRDGLLKILTKGADSSMIAVAAPGQETMVASMSDNLADFAREGLRTLVLGFRILSKHELESFAKLLSEMRMSGVDDPERSAELYSKIECNLTLVGCTAIDDKLQDEVPQTIEALKDAGIRVWVLTGDKVETAIAIGHSCNLLTDTTYNAIVDGNSLQEVQDQMYEYMAFVVGGQLAKEAFDQILQQQAIGALETETQGTDPDDASTVKPDEDAQSGCGRCMGKMKVCCGRPRETDKKRKKKQGNNRNTAVMSIEEFVSILTFNAKHKKIVAPVDGHSAPKQLSPEELERLIDVYVQNFNPKADEKVGAFSKLVGGKKPAAASATTVQVSPTRNTHMNVPNPQEIEITTSASKRGGDVEQYTSVAITITGDALQHALSTDETRKYFFGLAHLCSTVIACRVTPKQKAEVVRQCGRCTPTSSFCSLGIGDGANDVGMILTARIGIGILGKEGSQAARSADIAIGEFKILRNLLFAHGHTILRRHSSMMYQTIYKNFVFAMSGYLVGFVSGFSASDCFDPFLKQLYNLFFTPWPVMSIATFDRHLPYDILLRTAALYPIAMRPDGSYYYGPRNFFGWIAYALLCAGVIVAIPAGTVATSTTNDPGGKEVIDWASLGHIIFLLVVFVSISASIPFTHTVFWFTPLAFLLSAGSMYLCWAVMNSTVGAKLEGSLQILNTHAVYHLIIVNVYIISVGLLFIWWKYKVIFRPTPPVIIRERIKKGVFDVVVAPRKRDGLAVVVPRAHQKEVWKGFAYATSETRFSLRRRSLSYSFASHDSGSMLQARRGSSLQFIEEVLDEDAAK